LEIFEQTGFYQASFDIFHLAFAKYYNAQLITFDKGFKKLKSISKTDINIMQV